MFNLAKSSDAYHFTLQYVASLHDHVKTAQSSSNLLLFLSPVTLLRGGAIVVVSGTSATVIDE